MARVLPDLSEAELLELESESPGEAEVYRRCWALPNEWVVLHSVRSLTLEPGEGARDREGDFVILHPSYGMLVIEVKSGEIVFYDHKWFRRFAGTDKDIADPFEQATGLKHSLIQRLKANMRWQELRDRRMLARHAVLFPNVKRADPVRLPHVQRELVGAAPEVSDLERWVEQAYRFGETMEPWDALGADGVEIVLSILSAPFTTESLLGFRIGRESREQIRLTHEQWRACQCLRVENELAIGGAAGTGKTLLALRRAQDCAKVGLKTLLLCYNLPLADFLRHENSHHINVGEIPAGFLTTTTFTSFCSWVVRDHAFAKLKHDFFAQAKQDLPTADETERVWPQAMALALDACPLRYDVIIVDEAQDFGDSYWFALDSIWQHASKRYVFFDPNQSIFRRARSFPVSHDGTLMLRKNCRNTKVIHEYAYRFYMGPPEIEPPPIMGSELIRWEEVGIKAQARRLAREIGGLIQNEHVAPEDIAVLVLNAKGKKIAYESAESAFKNGPLLSIQSHGQKDSVLIDTVKRFKGLESGVVVLWVHEQPDADAFRELRYVGLSRARSVLVLLGAGTLLDTVLEVTASPSAAQNRRSRK
jgi:hypothetical protein